MLTFECSIISTMKKKSFENILLAGLFLLAILSFAILGGISEDEVNTFSEQDVEQIQIEEKKSISSDVKMAIHLIESVKHIFHTIQ